MVQFELRDVREDRVSSYVFLLQHHLYFSRSVNILKHLMQTFIQLLRDEVDPNTQTSESCLYIVQNVGGKDHNHEWVSVLNHEAMNFEGISVFLLENLYYFVSVQEHETWLKHLQKR